MISQQTKQSIDYIFAKSAKKGLVKAPDDICNIELISTNRTSEFSEKNIVVFTISSFLFRVLTIFHIGEDAATKNYFLNGSNDKAFAEIFSEAGNLCTGAMNHELSRHFPHLGMSTPYTLSGGCIQFLKRLKPGHQSLHAITINDSIRLHATVCMSGYAPINFTADKNIVEEETGGLELF